MNATVTPAPHPWGFSTRQIAFRLFLTCWLIYSLHFATNIVRDIYLALAIGDHLSFRVDEYAGLHADLFEMPGYGWHTGGNPGVSMVAAIPYAIARPVIDLIVERVNLGRKARGDAPPDYDSPWPMAREFHQRAWERGYDVKFGLGAFVMQAFAMAPISAAGVALMFLVLRRLFSSDAVALGLALLYAFGTPVFFRTGFLNQNLMVAHFAFASFVCLWDPGRELAWPWAKRSFWAGVAGGLGVLLDYSGVFILVALSVYAVARSRREGGSFAAAMRGFAPFVAGAAGPILLLWFYQFKSFGHPLYPGQHWMPNVGWTDMEEGYRGSGLPQFRWAWRLLLDPAYGLIPSSPLMALAPLALFWKGIRDKILPPLECGFLFGASAFVYLFFSGLDYNAIQDNTGIRYLAPILPFLFIPSAVALMRLPRIAIYGFSVLAITVGWCLAMYRDVESGLGVLDPILHVFTGGFQLPALTVLSRMGGCGDYFSQGVSPLPMFALTAAIICAVWSPRLAGLSRGA